MTPDPWDKADNLYRPQRAEEQLDEAQQAIDNWRRPYQQSVDQLLPPRHLVQMLINARYHYLLAKSWAEPQPKRADLEALIRREVDRHERPVIGFFKRLLNLYRL